MRFRGLPPYKNGVRVTHHLLNAVRANLSDLRGIDMTEEDFADDAKVAAKISASGLPMTLADVRNADLGREWNYAA